MAFTLTIYYKLPGDASTVTHFHLNGSADYAFENYVPKQPSPGEEIVEETISLRVFGGSDNLLLDYIRILNRAFEAARESANDKRGYAYLELYETSSYTLHAPLYDGKVMYDSLLFHADWANHQTLVTITLKRGAFWMASVVDTYNVTNLNGTNVNSLTTGLDVFNCNDGSGVSPNKLCNYIDLTPVYGDLPSNLNLAVWHMSNDASLIRNLYIGLNVGSRADDADYDLEFEDGTGGVETADAGASGGTYNVITWTEVVEKQIHTYTLTGANMRLYDHGQFKFLVKLFSAPARSDIYLKYKLLDGTAVLADSGWHLAQSADEIQEVGVIQLPPTQGSDLWTTTKDLTLALYAKCTTAGTKTLNGDFLQLMPVNHSYVKITDLGGNWGYYDNLYSSIKEPYNEDALLIDIWASTAYATSAIKMGDMVKLKDNRVNHLIFLHDLSDGTAPINHHIKVEFSVNSRYAGI